MLSLAMAIWALVALATASNAGPSLLFDAKSGQVIESEDPFARWYPASLTKLMTTYVAFRAVQAGEVTLQSPVRVSRNAANEPPSKMGYPVGTILTLDNALKIIMVKSANDIATSIGESLAGSEEAWAARMNAESKRLGMTGSHWANAHGLHDDAQYTTARDLGLLASALRSEFPQYASYFSIEGLSFGKQVIRSHNALIGRFEGADGMKTGYTCPAGYNLVASATRDGRTLMAIVIGATSVKARNEAAAGLLAKGFSQPVAGGSTLAAMQPSGAGINQATNMREALCTKAGSTALRKKEREIAAQRKKEGKPEPASYLAQRDTPRELIPISIGTATGPATPAVAALLIQDAAEKAAKAAEEAKKQAAVASGEDPSIPLPAWRPDMPAPEGWEPVAIGDSATLETDTAETETAAEDAAAEDAATAGPDPAIVTLDQ
ncbi:D-alanyl-D-alanine carboxypeptidase family protein [Mesorhizobium sp. KR9-304]|uniref:D-alanyl-D-alanine carboxypeptidase family protein n=1 Tax=Mesorhizobium sp. KR9-304 TaxID=3156614 RepID=UPI0032B571D8